MNRSLLGGIGAAIFTAFLVLATPAVSLADTSTLTLTIPARAPQVPTAKIRILLELASPPDASTQITVDNGTGPGPAIFGPIANGNAPNGDEVKLRQQPSTSSLTIFYTPVSRFVVDPMTMTLNLCQATIAEAQTVTINYTGPHIQGYRISSYTVPKEQAEIMGVPVEGTCSQAPRRIRINAPILAVNNVSPMMPVAVNKGRLPLDIILVLDKSGSMSGMTSGVAGPTTKWQLLKNSLGIFIGLWEAADTDMLGGSGLELVGDRIGLVYFDSVVTPASFSGGFFVNRAGMPGMGHSWQVILDDTNLPIRNPGGMTAMGNGLQAGIDAYTTVMDLWKNDATVILMTDGIQNVAPLVSSDASKWQIDPRGPPYLQDLGLPILSVYFGTPDPSNAARLEGIARQAAGTASIAGTEVEMTNSFSNLLVQALKGNTLSLLTRTENTLAAGVSQSAPQSFLLDGSVRRSVITLAWQGGNHPGLDLEIFPPGSAAKIAPVSTVDGPLWTVQSVDIPASGPIGEWKVRVVRKSPPVKPIPDDVAIVKTVSGANSFGLSNEAKLDGLPSETSSQGDPAVPYLLSIYSVEGKLEYQLTFPTANEGTGDAMVLAANVGYEGKPLANLPANAITLKIERPPAAAGTVMHENNVSPSILNTEIAAGGDVTTPYDRKVAELDKNGKLNEIRPQELATNFTLVDNGSASTGDKTANDAIYSARFADTSRPGLYRYKVTLDWDDPRTGRIHRTETIERFVKVNSDAAHSEVMVSKQDAGVYLIRVTPRDKFNNYFGPSSVNPIAVKLTGGGNVTSITDPNQTGDYIIRIENIPPGADPHVVIAVDGRPIRDDNISQLPGGSNQGFKRWGLSLHAGVSIPHGNFSNIFDPGLNFAVDLEYRFHPLFSIEGIYGFHHFNGTTIGGFTFSDVNMHQISLNGKVYGSTSPVRPFFNFGGGAYHITPSTRGGLNVGGGLQFDVNPNFAVEASYNFHNIFTSGSNTKFSTVQGGVRFRF